jgi:hypothetical protein
MLREARSMSTIAADCIARVAAALGDKAKKADIVEAAKQVERLTAEVLREGGSPADAVNVALMRYAKGAELAALIELRNANINALRFAERVSYVRTVWKGREAEGVRALLTGSIEARRGARASVALEQDTLNKQYLGQLTTEIERAGLFPVFKSGELDRDISRALWQLSKKNPKVDGLPKDAVTIARAIHKAQEVARHEANNAGAWIGKVEGWITRQSHDPWKLVKRGQQAWIAGIAPRLDWARMETQHGEIKDRTAWLAETYTNLAGGMHLKARGAETNSGFKGPGNLAKRMSQERVLHFKDADSWADYNAEFGAGNMREAVMHGLRSSAQNTGLMRVFGPNPEALYARVIDQLRHDVRASADVKAMKAFNTATAEDGWLESRLDRVTGKSSIAVSQMGARWSENLRAIQSMAKLGGAVITSVNDIATYASEISYQGRGFLSGISEGLGAIVQGRPKGERKEILSSLGVFFDSMTAEITRTGSLDESLGGGMSRAMQTFFKWNGLNWWTETLRGSAALSMSHTLAFNAGKGFDELAPELQRTLGLFDIGAKDWNHMRAKGVHVAEDGKEFLVPDQLNAEQAAKLRRYYVDRAQTAVLEPDADTKSMLQQGTRSGTISGELLRFVAQFKGYGVGFTRQVLGREVYGRGAGAFAEGSVYGLAKLIAASTVMGYAAMSIKDMLKGKSPRDPNDKDTYIRAFLQGGGAGIYADYLFGEWNRFGNSLLESSAGPVASTVTSAFKLWAGMTHEDSRGEYLSRKDAGDALRLALDNTPFLNLFYARPTLDYLILYDMQESVAPGTLDRMEQRAKDDFGQTFFLSPTSDRARPFTN